MEHMKPELKHGLVEYRETLSAKLSEIRRISDTEYTSMRDTLASLENQRTSVREELKRRLNEIHQQVEALKQSMKGFRSSQRAQAGDEAAKLAREIHYLTVLIGDRNQQQEEEGGN